MSFLSIVILVVSLFLMALAAILLQGAAYMMISTVYAAAGYFFSKFIKKYLTNAALLGNFVVAFVVAWLTIKSGSLPWNHTLRQAFVAFRGYTFATLTAYAIITQALVVIATILNNPHR